MRQSFQQFEAAFRESAIEERTRAERRLEHAAQRTHQRRRQRVRRHGTLRFLALVASIIATSVLVTFVMFETLAWLIGG
jgi:anti-sigma-K factor RskA